MPTKAIAGWNKHLFCYLNGMKCESKTESKNAHFLASTIKVVLGFYSLLPLRKGSPRVLRGNLVSLGRWSKLPYQY